MSSLWGIAITPNLWARLQSDTADRISDHAHCSVLIVKQVTGTSSSGVEKTLSVADGPADPQRKFELDRR